MDPIKAAIAAKIQTYLTDDVSYKFPHLPIEKIEFSAVDSLNTQVRVVTVGQGIRYFTVQLRENL
jgi:hypothetical protein